MTIRCLTLLLPVALSVSLAACDNRDYEVELAELQARLGDASSELDALRGENQSLSSAMDELRAEAEQTAAAAGSLGEEAAETVRSELESALEKASQTVDRLAALESEPDAPAATRTEAVGVLRSEVEDIVTSVRAAASELGLELQADVEPAAGAADEQAEPAAGEEPPEEPADEATQPQQ